MFKELGLSPQRSGSGSKVTLKIPAQLYRNLTELIHGTGFRSVTEFAVYVLREVAAGGKIPKELPSYSRKEIQAIYEQLRALGYVD